MTRAYLVYLLFLIPSVLVAQYPDLTIITKEEGLLNNRIEDIEQDSTGYIWIASSSGISRYNGTSFKHYYTREFMDIFFPASPVMRLFRDPYGGIWTSTAAGAILSYDPEADKFVIRNDSTTQLPAEGISYFMDDDENLWIGTRDFGLCYWNRNRNNLRIYSQHDSPDSLSDNFITDISRGGSDSVLVVSTTKGNCFLSIRENKFYRRWYYSSNPEDVYKHNVIRDFMETDDAYYAGTFGGLHYTTKSDFTTTHFFADGRKGRTLNHSSVWGMVVDEKKRVWVATYGGGINIFDPQKGSFEYITKSNSGMEEDNLRGIFRDMDGSIWVITDNTGLAKFDSRKNWIRSFSFNTLGIDGIMGLYLNDDSTLMIGANGGGLVSLDLKNNHIRNYLHDPEDPTSLGYNHVSGLAKDDKGNYWLSLAGGGMDYFNSAEETFQHFTFQPGEPSVPENALSTIHWNGELVWYGSYGAGYGTFDPLKREFTNFIFPNDSYDERLDVYRITSDTQRRLWILHGRGVVVSDRGELINLIHPGKPEMPVEFFGFLGFAESASGNIILLNNNKKLIEVDFDDGSPALKPIELPAALTQDYSFNDILVYEDSLIWLVASEGLIRYSSITGNYEVFDKDDGLIGNQFYSSNREGSDKIIAVASDEALNIIDLQHYYSIREGPKVHLDGISILNRPVRVREPDSVHGVSLNRNPDLMESLELDYGHKEFSLEFAALQFYSPEAVIYRYRMIGFNNNWLEDGRNRVSYTNLDPGTYTFEVQASLAPGIWGPSKRLNIKINPPFWETWWFSALVISAVAGLLYLIHRYRLQKAIALANLRNQIAQDLHDDIGSSLTKISLYSSLMADEKSDSGFLKQIGELSREVIGQMSDIVWSVDQKYDSAGNLISKMREFASETLEVCGVDLEFNTDNIQQNAFVDPLFRQNFYLIFKESINNICKHANASHVIVRVSFKDGSYRLVVEDDGKGISVPHSGVYAGSEQEPAVKAEGKGNGVDNMRKRAERIGLVFTIRDRENGGTVISLG